MSSRETTAIVVIALLAIVGIGLTSATIATTYTPYEGPGAKQQPGEVDGNLSGGSDVINRTPPEDRNDSGKGGENQPFELPEWCIEILTEPIVILLGVLGMIGAIGLAYYRRGFIAAAIMAYVVGIPSSLSYGLLTQCNDSSGPEKGGIIEVPGSELLGGGVQSAPVPPAVLLGVFALAALAAIVAIVSATGSEDIEPPSEDEEEPPDLEELGVAAGEAADRIESANADVDNAVYRAWYEMTQLLDLPSPETSTAGEFADAAVQAGMERADVDQLTTLFEEVRYGNMDPDPREDLAVETLRNIEERYGTPDADVDVDIDEETGEDGNGGEDS